MHAGYIKLHEYKTIYIIIIFFQSKQNSISLQLSGENLACCWANGRIDWRDGTGRVLRRVQMRSNAAAMLLADYRSIGSPDLICVSDKGEGLLFL